MKVVARNCCTFLVQGEAAEMFLVPLLPLQPLRSPRCGLLRSNTYQCHTSDQRPLLTAQAL